MAGYKISVIIPAYNIAPYLEECVKSVCSQTYDNMEIIIVDDGSTDRTPELCDRLAAHDKRIKVIHKANGGLSDARNTGLAASGGDYILFVDGDDRISVNTCETLANILEQEEPDVIFFGFRQFTGPEPSLTYAKQEIHTVTIEKLSKQEMLKILLGNREIEVVWNGIYKRDCIRDIPFPVGKIHEDVFWKARAIDHCDKIVRFNMCFYDYRWRNGSIMATRYEKVRFDHIDAFSARADYILQTHPELGVLARSNVLAALIDYEIGVSKSDYTMDERKRIAGKVRRCRKKYSLSIPALLKLDGISRMRKINLVLAAINPKLACRLNIIYDLIRWGQ